MGHCPCFGRREKKVIRFRNEDLKPTADDTSPDNCSVKMNPNLNPSSNIPVQVPNDNGNAERNAMLFSYRELATATNNFRQESFIGEGGFGAVYKGKLERTGQMVAVKQLNHSGLQGDKEFLVEVLMLSLLRHPNLVHLIGYCAEGEQRLLVYEFMPLGSLEYHLHDLTPDMEPLDWNTRMIIAAGAAKGLDFLHNHADPPVIYRDLKSANILLGEGFHPKLSDFGLAKFGPGKDQSHVSTRVMGTQGYCAPEYAGTGKLTMKSDIYSFGVVLLELITGRRALDMTHGNGKHILVDWARPMLRDRKNFIKLADPRLKGQFSEPILRRAMEVALMCLREDPQLRPGMADVVNALEYFISQQYDSNDKRSPEGEGQINHGMESFFESKDILQETKLLDKNVDRARAVADAKMWGELWRDKRQHRTQSDTDEVNR